MARADLGVEVEDERPLTVDELRKIVLFGYDPEFAAIVADFEVAIRKEATAALHVQMNARAAEREAEEARWQRYAEHGRTPPLTGESVGGGV